MSDLGKAYVQIVPSAKGISGAISKVLAPESDSAGKEGGGKYASSFASALKSGGAGIISTGAGIFAGLAGGLIGGATAAAAGFAKTVGSSAYQAYSSYEQLAGGTELLFGTAYDSVMKKSQEAYKTVQMSQNDYLQQVNGFAVGLKTALGGDEAAAAELSDKIITAEADIVAATGNSQEAVQNAFNGIMKSNYTMLDNLQLGITPTKAGMQEVIDKVNEWNAANGNATAYTIDNLADVQSALVDYVDMQGMAGYAGREAADTIEGSSASVSAAWENVVTAIGRGEGIDEAFNGLVDSLFGENGSGGFLGQIATRIPTIMQGIGDLVTTAAPILSEYIPPLIDQILPTVITTLGTVMSALAEAIPPYFPLIAETFGQVVDTVGQTLSQQFPQLSFIFDNLGTVIKGAFAVFMGGQIISAIMPIVSVLGGPLTIAIGAVIAVGVLLYKNWDTIKEKAAELKEKVSTAWTNMKTSIANSQIGQVVGKVWNAAKTTMQNSLNAMKTAYDKHGGGLKGAAAAAMEGVKQYYSAGFHFIDNLTGGKLSSMLSTVKDKFDAIKGHIKDAIDAIKGFFDNLKLKLPDIKLPHFSLTGSFSINPPSVPHLSVEWYRKAMDQAYLLNSATIFGANGRSLLGGGEAGSEMIIGTQKLMDMISRASGGNAGGREVVFNNTFNIYAGDRDAKELAEEISYYLEADYQRKARAFA